MNIAELTISLHNNTLSPIRRIAKKHCISSSQLLCIISIPSDGINQTNLAALLSIDISTLSRNLHHLIKKKLITKKNTKYDNRSYQILITKDGEILCNKIFQSLESYFNDINLILDDQEIETLIDVLLRFNWLLFKKKTENAPI